MSGAYQAAVAMLRRCQQGLAADPSPEERARLLALSDEALRLLEAGRPRRPSTLEIARRVAKLDRQLREHEPGERAEIIRARLGLSRSAYYRVRKIACSPDVAGLPRASLES